MPLKNPPKSHQLAAAVPAIVIFGQVAHCRISFASYRFWPFLMTLLSLSSYSFCLPAVTLPMAGSLSLSLPDFCLKGKERLIVVYELYGCCLLTVPSYVSSLQQNTFCRSSFPVMKLWHIEAKCRKDLLTMEDKRKNLYLDMWW